MYKIVIFQVEGGRVDKNLDVAYEGGGGLLNIHMKGRGVSKDYKTILLAPPPML